MHTQLTPFVLLALLTGLALAPLPGLRADDEPAKKKLPPPAEQLEPYSCGTVERLHTFGGIFLASQPQPADLEQAKAGGVRTVVSLRRKDELDWDEEAVALRLGLEFHQIPFKTPDELTDEVFDRVRALLVDPAKPEETEVAKQFNKRLIERALRLEGTCTGEHGVGMGKMGSMRLELGDETIGVMRDIKKVLDPDNLMNPGKVVPLES